ncbi:phage holin family protein [Gallibacterium anatis]|uniref:Phage holin family protein n=1 Tax=Gallibacterium anatis TaxID=750 RepID=A0A930UWP8_9PAST|nr:phage holin family protein [Gallibacterium anatis]
MKMPEKDPNVWLIIWALHSAKLQCHHRICDGFFMSLLRAAFTAKTSYRQRMLDGAICGAH